MALIVREIYERHGPKACVVKGLSGMCGDASFALTRWLCSDGHEANLVLGMCRRHNRVMDRHVSRWAMHAWVEAYGKIYDVTATQFGHRHRVRVVRTLHPDYIADRKGLVAYVEAEQRWRVSDFGTPGIRELNAMRRRAHDYNRAA